MLKGVVRRHKRKMSNNIDLLDRAARAISAKNATALIPAAACSDLSQQIVGVLRQLAPDDQILFFNIYNRRKKNREWAQLFALFAAQYCYLRRPLTQLIFWITVGGLGIWYIYDLFAIQEKVAQENEFIALEALDAVKGL